MSCLKFSVSSDLKILAWVSDILGKGKEYAAGFSLVAFCKAGDVTVALIQKMALKNSPGRTVNVVTRRGLLKAQLTTQLRACEHYYLKTGTC